MEKKLGFGAFIIRIDFCGRFHCTHNRDDKEIRLLIINYSGFYLRLAVCQGVWVRTLNPEAFGLRVRWVRCAGRLI